MKNMLLKEEEKRAGERRERKKLREDMVNEHDGKEMKENEDDGEKKIWRNKQENSK